MKQYLLFKILFCFINVVSFAQYDKQYHISGSIKGLPSDTRVFLIRRDSRGVADTVSVTNSMGGTFYFKGSLIPEGENHFVKIDTSSFKLKNGVKSYVRIFLTNTDIKILGEIEQWPEVTIHGSSPTTEFEHLLLDSRRYGLTKEFAKQLQKRKEDSIIITKKRQEYAQFLGDYIAKHRESYVVPYFIESASGFLGVDKTRILYQMLSTSSKDSFWGRKIKDKINAADYSLSLSVGNSIPEFWIETSDGKIISVKEVIKKSKFTLIDFWAYWCVPCREDVPNMKKVYAAFNKKGFDILSVSVDRDREKWRKAIKEDNTSWHHGMDMKEASRSIFGISAIPAYILVNDKGEMQAIDAPLSKLRTADSSNSRLFIRNNSNMGLRSDLFGVIDRLFR